MVETDLTKARLFYNRILIDERNGLLMDILKASVKTEIKTTTTKNLESSEIEMIEAFGQRLLKSSSLLPIVWTTRLVYKPPITMLDWCEKVGIEIVKEFDDLFYEVKLPEGWKIESTENPFWSHLLDDKERVRAAIFYKASFHDRKAHISAITRYHYDPYDAVVRDVDTIIYKCDFSPFKPDGSLDFDLADKAGVILQDWLFKHYPDWKDPSAYWD